MIESPVELARTPREHVVQTLRIFHEPGAVVEIRMLKTKFKTISGYFTDPEEAAKAAYGWDGHVDAIYFTVNPINPNLLARANNKLAKYAPSTTADDDVLSRRWFLVDFDPKRPSGISSTDEQHEAAIERALACRELLRERGWPDPVLADSGNGAHLNYRVDLPQDAASHELASQALATLGVLLTDERVCVDQTTHNAARIWKLYGTKTCKGELIPGLPHRRSKLLSVPESVVPVTREQLEALAAESRKVSAPPARVEKPGKTNSVVVARETRPFDIDEWIQRYALPVESMGAWQGGRKWILNPCPWTAEHTNGSAVIMQFPSGAVAARCHHNSCTGKDWHALRDLYEPEWRERRAAQEQAPTEAPRKDAPPRTDGSLLELDAGDTDLPRISELAWNALLARNQPPLLFVSARLPVRIDVDPKQGPAVQDLNQDRMRYEVCRAAFWYRRGKGKKDVDSVQDPAAPPMEIIKDMLARPRLPLPRLERIVHAPTFAADGTLTVEPGYSEASECYYWDGSGLEVPPVPDEPTASDVAEAKTWIHELIGEFPFSGDAEYAHATAFMLLPFVRNMIAGPTPLHLFEKPTQGTGGTLLAKVLAYPFLGRNPAMLTEAGKDEGEWRKRLTAVLLELPSTVVVDNLRETLDSAALASCLTANTWTDRYLGKSQMTTMTVRCAWAATGNNPNLSGEMARRTIRCRIDSQEDRPWDRDGFKHPNLEGWAAENRGRLIWAALVLARAWLAAGRPGWSGKKLGSYEDWCDVIGGILTVADIPGFLGNLTELYAQSDESACWRSFVSAWWEREGPHAVTTGPLVALCNGGDGMPDLGEGSERSQRTRLGILLTKHKDRRFGQLRIVSAGRPGNLQHWRLALVHTPVPEPEPEPSPAEAAPESEPIEADPPDNVEDAGGETIVSF